MRAAQDAPDRRRARAGRGGPAIRSSTGCSRGAQGSSRPATRTSGWRRSRRTRRGGQSSPTASAARWRRSSTA
jgi:hypothetical protein